MVRKITIGLIAMGGAMSATLAQGGGVGGNVMPGGGVGAQRGTQRGA